MRPQQPEHIQEEPNQSGFTSFKKGATIGAIAGGILGISAGVSFASMTYTAHLFAGAMISPFTTTKLPLPRYSAHLFLAVPFGIGFVTPIGALIGGTGLFLSKKLINSRRKNIPSLESKKIIVITKSNGD